MLVLHSLGVMLHLSPYRRREPRLQCRRLVTKTHLDESACHLVDRVLVVLKLFQIVIPKSRSFR
jgi:hypothetical protein